MEYIFGLGDGRRVLVYDDGNNLNLNLIGNRIGMRGNIIERDYLSQLSAYCDGRILYIVYFSILGQLIFKSVDFSGVRDNKIVLFDDRENRWNIGNLRLIYGKNEIYVFYQVINPASQKYEVRYIKPDGDRKSNVLFSQDNKFYVEQMYVEGKNTPICEFDFGETQHIVVVLDSNNCVSGDLKEEKRRYEANKCKMEEENKMLKNEIEDYRSQIKICEEKIQKNALFYENELDKMKSENEIKVENIRKTLENQYKQAEEKYVSQYNELSSLVKDIQEEGKRWRELYYKSIKKK